LATSATTLLPGEEACVARLSRENEALRGALGDAVRRLSELEGQQERFMSEDVFDLVNCICRESGPASDELAEEDLAASAALLVTTPTAEPVIDEGPAPFVGSS